MQYALNYSCTKFLSTENQNYSVFWWPGVLRVPNIKVRKKISRLDKDKQELWNVQQSTPLFRTASGQQSFEYRATSLWNDFQPALKLSKVVTSKSVNLGDFFWTSPSVVS